MKRILTTVLFAFAFVSVFASVVGGDMASVKVATTEHFDVIYKDQGSETAAVIFDNCEKIYSSLVTFFGVDPKMHIPVVVTSVYKELNAYYSIYPANRIVILDTVFTPGDLSNFESSILGVFRHELTHAFHYNIRGPVFQTFSEFFGDIVTLSPIFYLYPSLTEGGAVLSESVDGYGRLNSSYSIQIVRQAKLEGLFPNWFEVAGARDTYPSGLLYYNFAAAFLDYLAQTYGLETVNSIYESFAHLKLWSTPGQVIKSKIGKSVKQAWKDFYDWVEVPTDVITADQVASRRQSASYSTPVVSPDGYVYVYDYSTWEVLRFSEDLSRYESVLTFPTFETSLSISDDGRLLLLPVVFDSSASVRLYDISGSGAKLLHTFSSAERDYRDGAFVQYDGSTCILLYGNEGKSTYLDLYSLSTSEKPTFEKVEGKSLFLGFDRIAFGFNAAGPDKVVFVTTYEARDNIAILNLKDMDLNLVENPDDIKIYSLSASTGAGGAFSFSWYPDSASETNTGRYGEVLIGDDGASVRLSGADVLGSVNGPVRIADSIVFSTRLFERLDFRCLEVAELSLSDPVNVGFSSFDHAERPDTDSLVQSSAKYRPIRYFKDGVLIPYATATFGNASALGFGFSWITQDPTETYLHEISVGFGDGNLLGSYTFTNKGLVPYSVFANVAYGIDWLRNENSLPIGGALLNAGASVSGSFEFGSPYRTLSIEDEYSYTMWLPPEGGFAGMHNNIFQIQFNSVRKAGMGVYQRYAFVAAAYADLLLPGIKVGLSLPSLLWWRCDGPNITNLPFSVLLDAHFEDGYDNISLTGQASVILYGREIQRAVQFLGLHVQRFTLKASYIANYKTASEILTHQAELCAKFTFTPIVGAYLTKIKTELGATLVWNSTNDDLEVKLYFGLVM